MTAAVLRTIVALAAAGIVSFPTAPPTQRLVTDAAAGNLIHSGRRRAVSPPSNPARPMYTSSDIEYYLSEDALAYIRPGVKIRINSVTIPSDLRTVVDFNLMDAADQPLDREGKLTPGTVSLNWLMAWYDPDTRLYTSYLTRTQTGGPGTPGQGQIATQATGENNGVYTTLETGHYTYRFNRAIAAGFDPSKTHTVGIYGSRQLTEAANFIDKTYYVNVEHDFRPDGAAVVDRWDIIREAKSCHNCHDQATFGLHGGSRRDIKLCVLCHTPQTTDPDTGNSVDFALMIHKIHSGPNLAHDYTIIGNGQSVHDFSEVTFPQDRRNCNNCHEGSGTTQEQPAMKHVYYTFPSRRACGACHDNIDWVTGAGHPAGPQPNDNSCAVCHVPDSGMEYDASIKGAHTIEYESKQLTGLKAQIVSVSNVGPGLKPTVAIRLTDRNGPVDGTKLATFAPIHAGPTSSYRIYYRENGLPGNASVATFDAATGLTSYTFVNPIPADAKGSWGFSGDFRRPVTIHRAVPHSTTGATTISFNEGAVNPIFYAAVTGELQPRRQSVDVVLCNKCHDRLALHGGQRLDESECVMCHNPTNSDVNQRPADQGPPESISFQRLIHRIHSGVNLAQDFTVYGNGKSVHNFNEVTFPNDRRNCGACHVNNSQQVPPGGDAVATLRDFFSPQGPGTAACLGCHDNQDAAAHAFLNTTQFGGKPAEACGVCHGQGSDWAVDKVHAR